LDTNGDKKVDTLDEIRGLIFTNVMAPMGAMKKPYEEILELPKLTEACEESL
jgi:dynein heavy chain